MNLAPLTLALLCLLPIDSSADVSRETCDRIEVNHLFDERGQPVFSQVLFWDWDRAAGRHQLRDWRLLKSVDQVPCRDFHAGGVVTLWRDGVQWREIRAPFARETWTQHDPELLEREILPRERRRELWQPLPAEP